ncbi:MAG: plastocyanin/azurin family copper-binding protein [Halobacteriaceae archaeon]
MKRRHFLTATTGIIPFVAGCMGGGNGGGDNQQPTPTATTTATEQQSADKTIAMKNSNFQTLKAEVNTGATVKWVNKDSFAHTVTSTQFHDKAKAWNFDTQVSAGGSTTFTFDQNGVYEYYCTIHGKGSMCGAVLVGGATLDKSLPCGGGGNGGGYY